MLVFCCIFGRVCPLSCRGSGDPSGRGHVVVPRGRRRSVLPARASLAHSDPLVSSSIAFCWALRRVRRSWGRYIRPQEWTLGSKSRAVAVNSRATLLLSDGASCLTAASYVRLTPSCVVTLCDLSKICTIAVPVGSGLITVKTSNFDGPHPNCISVQSCWSQLWFRLSFRCCWFLSMCSCMPCPIVYICRSVCSSAIPCVPGTPIYRPVLVTLGSSIPNYHHAHLNPLVFKYHFCWLVCCSAVVSTSRSCTNDQLVFQRCLSLGHFCVQCHVWRRRFCLILFFL